MLGCILRGSLFVGSRSLHRKVQLLWKPQEVMWRTALVPGANLSYLGLKDSQDDFRRKKQPRLSSNKEPLGMKRTWNISYGALKKLRYDVLRGKGYSVFSFKSPREDATGALPNVNTIFSKEKHAEDIKEELITLTNADLIQVLIKVAKSQDKGDLLNRLKLLEGECCQRLKTLSIRDKLYIADLFFMLSFPASRFYVQMFSSFDVEWDKNFGIGSQQVVQLLFYIGVYRNGPVHLMEKIEHFLCQNINSFSGLEMSVVCNAFFASNRSIRSAELLEGICLTIMNDLDNVYGIPLFHVANVLKVLRHSQFTDLDFLMKIGDKLCKNIPSDTSVNSLATIISCFSSLRIVHLSLCLHASQVLENKINSDLHNLRSKDLSRMLSAFCNFQLSLPPSLVSALIERIRVLPGVLQMFPAAYVEAIMGLAMVGTYPHDLINDMLSPDFHHNHIRAMKVKGQVLEQEHQLLLIDTAVGIEQPDYDGHRLGEEILKSVCEKQSYLIGLELNIRKGLAAMWWTLMQLLGDNTKVRCRHVCKFSHIADLEMWLDKDNRPLPIPVGPDSGDVQLHLVMCEKHATGRVDPGWDRSDMGEMSVVGQLFNEESGSEKPLFVRPEEPEPIHLQPMVLQESFPDNSSKRRIAIKVMGWNQYLLNKPMLLGIHAVELRLLTRMGYEVFVINPKKARDLQNMTLEARESFVLEHVLQPLEVNME